MSFFDVFRRRQAAEQRTPATVIRDALARQDIKVVLPEIERKIVAWKEYYHHASGGPYGPGVQYSGKNPCELDCSHLRQLTECELRRRRQCG